jgi:tetratricopeptide (TPR) repeat protein
MMRFTSVTLLALLLAACGGGGAGGRAKVLDKEDDSGRKSAGKVAVSKAAAASFDAALDVFLERDKKGDWSQASCKEVAGRFEKASDEQESATNKELPEALYNAGLAQQRCGNDTEARTKFEEAIRADAGFHRAKAQLTLYAFMKTGDVDETARELDQIIRDAKFQNVEALTSLAALQMERGNDQPDADGKNDLERARRNLQRALAIDDGYMPAYNQLAVYYLELAKTTSGQGKQASRSRRGKRGMEVSGADRLDINEQQLDLAALVASQAQRKNPNYAPIHNTTGLIQVQLKNFNAAVKSFGRARQLDPKFFEAQMNYAAVNLSFRGFDEAEKAYRDALKLRPNEYEAHLGLALALRGAINDSNFDKNVTEAQKHLDEAKKVDGARPETYYNEAILTHEYRSKRGNNPIPMLTKASEQYRAFVDKASDDPVFAAAVKRSKERTQDIDDTIKFIKEGEQAKKDDELAQAQAKEIAAQEAKDKAAADKAAADKAAADKAAGKPGATPAPGAKPGDPAKPADASKGVAPPASSAKAPAPPAPAPKKQ